MSELPNDQSEAEKLSSLKRRATTVYLLQLLSFAFAGLPLLAGVFINFMNRDDVQGTWVESHFNWQIQTAWMTLAGFAVSGLILYMGMIEVAMIILTITVLLLVYRIVVGWIALSGNRAVKE